MKVQLSLPYILSCWIGASGVGWLGGNWLSDTWRTSPDLSSTAESLTLPRQELSSSALQTIEVTSSLFSQGMFPFATTAHGGDSKQFQWSGNLMPVFNQSMAAEEVRKPVFESEKSVSDIQNSAKDSFYEAFVHPVMLAQKDPQRVAVILGHQPNILLGKILRQLSHYAIEDLTVVDVSGRSRGSKTLLNSTSSLKDAIYDVVILAPGSMDSEMPIVEDSVRILNRNGIMVAVSPSSTIDSTPLFPSNQLEAIRVYSEGSNTFWAGFKIHESLEGWYNDEATINLRIHQRVRRQSSLEHIDSANLMQYQYPSRSLQDQFCKDQDNEDTCIEGLLDPELENTPISSFAVKNSTIENAGRGVFFQQDVKEGSYIAADELVQALVFYPPTTTTVMQMKANNLTQEHAYVKVLGAYMFGYGFADEILGGISYAVEPSILTFINHGCNYTYNQGTYMSVSELTADLTAMPAELDDYDLETYVYNPFLDRNQRVMIFATEFARRDVKAGEELFDNYLSFFTEENWHWAVANLRDMCLQQGEGMINTYQNEHRKE